MFSVTCRAAAASLAHRTTRASTYCESSVPTRFWDRLATLFIDPVLDILLCWGVVYRGLQETALCNPVKGQVREFVVFTSIQSAEQAAAFSVQ